MYIYIHTYIYMHMRLDMHMYMRVHMYLYMHVLCAKTETDVKTFVLSIFLSPSLSFTDIHTDTQPQIHTDTQTDARTYTHTHTHQPANDMYRTSQLVSTVRSWQQGRCVAALWLPECCADEARRLHANLEDRKSGAVIGAGERWEGSCARGGTCAVDLVLIWVTSEHARYPINALRNAALAHAQTDLVLLSDVDQLPASNTCELLHNIDVLASLVVWCCRDR